MWQRFRDELHGEGFELVTVGMDAAGAEACRPFMEAAEPTHPALVDTQHLVAELFGVVNIPNGVWIDETGTIVRPAEPAPAPPSQQFEREHPFAALETIPDRMIEIAAEAGKIRADPAGYEDALRDWIANGEQSRFALEPDEVVARSEPRDHTVAAGQAHFELAAHLERLGDHDAAIRHFREAHRMAPRNFGYRRQAWSLEPSLDGPLQRFWQGPQEGREGDWPYEGDWLSDVRAMGAENYYPEWRP